MSVTIRGKSDKNLKIIREALLSYGSQHPEAEIVLYRRNAISVRIRVVDPCFAGLSKPARHELVWKSLQNLPDELQSDISMVVLLSPDEVQESLGNLEFEHPSPSLL